MSEPTNADAVFAGSVPRIYDEYLVPLIFEVYAADLVERLQHISAGSALELACGTGVVTRQLATGLDDSVEIVGSDLNQAMIDHAATVPREHGGSTALVSFGGTLFVPHLGGKCFQLKDFNLLLSQ